MKGNVMKNSFFVWKTFSTRSRLFGVFSGLRSDLIHFEVKVILALLAVFGIASQAAGAPITYVNRAQFEGQLGTFITDTYSSPGYTSGDRHNLTDFDIFSDSAMSAVFGETDYKTTGFSSWNFIQNQAVNASYCAGCNGSFRLGFAGTSVGNAVGVYGVGFNYINQPSLPYYAFVVFGDGATANYALASNNFSFESFFGVTSDQLIQSIHLGLEDGVATTDGSFALDNLTIGNASTQVPEPSSLLLLGIGLAGAILRKPMQHMAGRRRQRGTVAL
jgi:hypothetical protein